MAVPGWRVLPVSNGVVLLLTSLFVGYLTLDILLKVIKRINIAYLVFVLGLIIITVGLIGVG